MSKRSELAVVDAGVIILYGEFERAADKDRHRRWLDNRECIRRLRDDGIKFVVPAPAMVELEMGGESSSKLANKLAQRQESLDVVEFDYDAVLLAGKMLKGAHKELVRAAPGEGRRNVVKFDALIAATAVAHQARYLLTTNPKDFERLLREVQNHVEVIDTTRARGQVVLLA